MTTRACSCGCRDLVWAQPQACMSIDSHGPCQNHKKIHSVGGIRRSGTQLEPHIPLISAMLFHTLQILRCSCSPSLTLHTAEFALMHSATSLSAFHRQKDNQQHTSVSSWHFSTITEAMYGGRCSSTLQSNTSRAMALLAICISLSRLVVASLNCKALHAAIDALTWQQTIQSASQDVEQSSC